MKTGKRKNDEQEKGITRKWFQTRKNSTRKETTGKTSNRKKV